MKIGAGTFSYKSELIALDSVTMHCKIHIGTNIELVLKLILYDSGYPNNRPFALSGHMVRNKLCWDATNAVGLDWQEFLCFGTPTALFGSQHNLFRTM